MKIPTKIFRFSTYRTPPVNKKKSGIWTLVSATTGNTDTLRPILGHTTHGTDSDQLSWFLRNQGSIHIALITHSHPSLFLPLCLICGTESVQLACFSLEIWLLLLCKPHHHRPDLIRYEASRCHDPTVQCCFSISSPNSAYKTLRWAKARKVREKDAVVQSLPVLMLQASAESQILSDLIFLFIFNAWRKQPAQAQKNEYLDRGILILYICLDSCHLEKKVRRKS